MGYTCTRRFIFHRHEEFCLFLREFLTLCCARLFLIFSCCFRSLVSYTICFLCPQGHFLLLLLFIPPCSCGFTQWFSRRSITNFFVLSFSLLVRVRFFSFAFIFSRPALFVVLLSSFFHAFTGVCSFITSSKCVCEGYCVSSFCIILAFYSNSDLLASGFNVLSYVLWFSPFSFSYSCHTLLLLNTLVYIYRFHP